MSTKAEIQPKGFLQAICSVIVQNYWLDNTLAVCFVLLGAISTSSSLTQVSVSPLNLILWLGMDGLLGLA